jgi:transcriptional regulator with PAS, ATPase and Fis domain
VAPTPTTVLITGESGTGKELVARAIHALSARRNAPFVGINCASIPSALLESELFGHERGSFTSATKRKLGLFEEASHGTLFLDEIGEMEPAMQAKLLRVLQEKSIRRVGGVREVTVDVRVVTATNRDLVQRMASGAFREDLFYRLNVFPIPIPPLRERREDIPILAKFYLDDYSRAFGAQFQEIAPEALRMLQQYRWPGNIRELRNILERICIMHRGPVLLPSYLPPDLTDCAAPVPAIGPCPTPLPEDAGLEEAMEALEKTLITSALGKAAGNVLQAAQLLKIPRGTLRYKMEKYGL